MNICRSFNDNCMTGARVAMHEHLGYETVLGLAGNLVMIF